MVGTKEKLDRRGDIICSRDEETLYWCEKAWYDTLDNSGIEIDWKWEARDKADDKLFYKFIDEHDYWEMFCEFIRDYNSDMGDRTDTEALDYIAREGIVATAKELDLHDYYMWFICDDEDMAEEYVEWLN